MFQSVAVLAFATLAVSQTSYLHGCVGVWLVDQGYDNGACCIGGSISAPYQSTCPGWPICSGPATTTTTSEPLSCATVIPSDDNYSSNLAVATSSLAASGTNIQTTLGAGGAAAGGAPATTSSGPAASNGVTGTTASASATGNGGTINSIAGFGLVGGAVGLLAAFL